MAAASHCMAHAAPPRAPQLGGVDRGAVNAKIVLGAL
eukprot:SAG31_NODE_29971_length_387_cov_0.715278_1_plen_36_part_01